MNTKEKKPKSVVLTIRIEPALKSELNKDNLNRHGFATMSELAKYLIRRWVELNK
jgi:hypothetical protein